MSRSTYAHLSYPSLSECFGSAPPPPPLAHRFSNSFKSSVATSFTQANKFDAKATGGGAAQAAGAAAGIAEKAFASTTRYAGRQRLLGCNLETLKPLRCLSEMRAAQHARERRPSDTSVEIRIHVLVFLHLLCPLLQCGVERPLLSPGRSPSFGSPFHVVQTRFSQPRGLIKNRSLQRNVDLARSQGR